VVAESWSLAEAEARASAYKPRGIDLWSGMGSGVGHAWILAQLMESRLRFRMSQDKMTPMITLGTP
jgi:hypothetical protein